MADEQRIRSSRGSSTSVISSNYLLTLTWILLAILSLIFIATWMVSLEQSLPDVRAPRDPGSSAVLSGHALMLPGYHNIGIVDPELSGDWLMQEMGESDWLATDQANSRLRTAFYGTELYLLARVGPEAGRAYVRVNGRPVEHLALDEAGSYVNLWAGRAADRPILVATGLAHGEHLAEVTSAGDGEVAISGFDVVAETPFYWAFVLVYAGLAGGLFVVIRSLLIVLSTSTGTRSRTQVPDSASASR